MKVVHLFSGGLDSTTALYWLLKQGYEVSALSIHYGQRHQKELQYAAHLCELLKLESKSVDLSAIQPLIASSSQTSDDLEVPEGHYADENMKLTVVPNRNMMMLSVAAAWAISKKADAVCYAAHSGDHTIYPDCRPEFAEAISAVFKICDWHSIELLTPFIDKTKTEIVKIGCELKVPFVKTWSCYKGLDKHCGKCGTCIERKEAFSNLNREDPTPYEDLQNQ